MELNNQAKAYRKYPLQGESDRSVAQCLDEQFSKCNAADCNVKIN